MTDTDTKTGKTITVLPTLEETERAKDIFATRYIARFIQKHRKYRKLLKEHGANLSTGISNSSVNFCASFEDEVEMIVSEKRNKIKHACKIKGLYNVKGLFRQIYKIVRRARASRIECKLLDISTHEMIDSLKDIGVELAVAYEYQITMLISETDVRSLADHAVSCSMNYLKDSDATFNRCAILEAITDVEPKKSFSRAEKVATRIEKHDHVKGTRQQKWRLSEIFKQPGLRVPNDDGIDYTFYGCFTPYGSLCRPDKYGFRGPLHVWCDKTSRYDLLYNDKVSCNSVHKREIERDDSCVHQSYKPFTLCTHPTFFETISTKSGDAYSEKSTQQDTCTEQNGDIGTADLSKVKAEHILLEKDKTNSIVSEEDITCSLEKFTESKNDDSESRNEEMGSCNNKAGNEVSPSNN